MPQAADVSLTHQERDAIEKAVVMFCVYHPDLAVVLRTLLERSDALSTR